MKGRQFGERTSDFEVILNEPQHSFRWYEHDYPYPLARWNHHPEFEIHLIRQGNGKLLAGDYIGHFGPGHVALMGPGLPHDWISDLAPEQVIQGRDVVLQFDGEALLCLRETLPELGALQSLFSRARQGIEFRGETARTAARLLEAIGQTDGLKRLALFLSLLETLVQAGADESRILASPHYAPMLDSLTTERMNRIFDYILGNLAGEIRMSVIAQHLQMSEPAFSRFFKRTTGHTFVGLIRKLRIQRACRLLLQSQQPIAEICLEVGYGNLSNFNRHFRHEMHTTPSDYRKQLAMRSIIRK
ncbi:transcriptional regulator, AraC family [Azotobacter vinelandii CA]|uniref:Transcriptional regulator, AraC family n=2 Tax=Azotobacter vinelandii TaxID=354 RepID=C1DSB8_AZOVD|nr:AraC family transcriptional regulator [Azotobacter vinelandii]ACO77873.1 transcriptional regulator, AraC family [Azotobacter vinelandii DJ]AGK15243.1 transcriptional regulator, AraC family [Azotobacter vinelandii CA]AGK20039.1 transcriptional regulator, AraC family [Azotobacter vinelandii CA6]SFY30738.1 transcriptional regulator, AraC family [Azotobacter vinelandii]GLK60149.1 AraC family transcriptional regulator [Azotobacter vinelandii]